MSRFSLVGPSYKSQSLNVDDELLMNFYIETVESQAGKGPLAMYPTPGLNVLYNLGSAPMRGIETAQGRTFAVQGTNFWELLSPTASPNKINRGNVVSDGQAVSMHGGGFQFLIASAGTAYLFDMNANTLTPVAALAGLTVLQVGWSDTFFTALAVNPGFNNKLYASFPGDGTNWPGLSVTIPSVFPDSAIATFVDHRELWVFGPKAIQPYFDSGNFPFPFDIISGAYIESGLAAPFSVAKLDNSLFWLGADERGNGVVRRAEGYVPKRVSNHAVEFAMQSYSTIADAIAYGYQDQGHDFYVLTFPTAEKTWVYDAATGMWHERGYWNVSNGTFTRHRAQFHTFNFGIHLVGDPTTGLVYQMAIPAQVGNNWTFVTDNGNPIRRVRRAPHISTEQEWTFHAKLQVDVETGLGPNPPFQGFALPTSITLADANGVPWSITVTDVGLISVQQIRLHPPQTLFLNDPGDTTAWQVVVSTLGILDTIPVAFNSGYPDALPFVSQGGGKNFVLQVTTLGVLTTVPNGIVPRGPLMMMKFSNDGGHTWSNEQTRDCGMAGEYSKRVIWWRLGRARDRVYEISCSDPIPWRIIDGYIEASPGFVPAERMISEARKRA